MKSSDDGKTAWESIRLFRREAVEHHLRGYIDGALLPRSPQLTWSMLSFSVLVAVLTFILSSVPVPNEISTYGRFAGAVSQASARENHILGNVPLSRGHDPGREWLIRISPPTDATDAFRLGQIIDITARRRLVQCRILHVSRVQGTASHRPTTAVVIIVRPADKNGQRAPVAPLALGETVRVTWSAGFVQLWHVLL